jgi:hypothetical protein
MITNRQQRKCSSSVINTTRSRPVIYAPHQQRTQHQQPNIAAVALSIDGPHLMECSVTSLISVALANSWAYGCSELSNMACGAF